MEKKTLYLDDAATMRVWPEVVEEMEKCHLDSYGNPSSLHAAGEGAAELLKSARENLASVIGAKVWEIFFTSGGTEGNNIALRANFTTNPKKKNRIVISSIEHPSVNEVAKFLGKNGYKVVKIPVDSDGLLRINSLEKELLANSESIYMVSVMHVNNIFGGVQNIKKIGGLCRKYNVLFHTDASQSFGKLDIDILEMNVDLLTASAHKIGGPKGVGLLYVREGVKIAPWLLGGGQEKNLRSGTENVPGVVGFAKALEVYEKNVDKGKIQKLRDRIIVELEKIGGRVNGAMGDRRIFNNIHVSFEGIDSESLVMFLSDRDIYVSAGSACDSRKDKEIYVLKALGLSKREISGSIRISLGIDIDKKDVEKVVKEIAEVLKIIMV